MMLNFLIFKPQYVVNILKSPFIPKGHIQYAPTKGET